MIVTRLYLKKPSKTKKGQKSRIGKRRTYSVVKRETENGKYLRETPVKDSAIDSINERFLNGDLTKLEAEKAFRDFIHSLEKKLGLSSKDVFNNDNMKILEQFWKKEYSTRDIVDTNTAYCDFRRAVEAIGEKSLQTSSQLILEKEIKKKFKGEKQRRIASRLNQLLKFLKRDIVLRKDKPERRKVRYLTESEFKAVLIHVENEGLRALAETCFYSGMRLGEAFGFEEEAIVSKDTIKVYQQLKEDGSLTDTKNGKERTTFFFKQGSKALNNWLELRDSYTLSRTNTSKLFKKACIKTFPKDKKKHCTIHDLRHSYAIMLVSRGVSLSLVAQSLGNSVSVCEKYYTGFVLTNESIDYIRKLVES